MRVVRDGRIVHDLTTHEKTDQTADGHVGLKRWIDVAPDISQLLLACVVATEKANELTDHLRAKRLKNLRIMQ